MRRAIRERAALQPNSRYLQFQILSSPVAVLRRRSFQPTNPQAARRRSGRRARPFRATDLFCGISSVMMAAPVYRFSKGYRIQIEAMCVSFIAVPATDSEGATEACKAHSLRCGVAVICRNPMSPLRICEQNAQLPSTCLPSFRFASSPSPSPSGVIPARTLLLIP